MIGKRGPINFAVDSSLVLIFLISALALKFFVIRNNSLLGCVGFPYFCYFFNLLPCWSINKFVLNFPHVNVSLFSIISEISMRSQSILVTMYGKRDEQFSYYFHFLSKWKEGYKTKHFRTSNHLRTNIWFRLGKPYQGRNPDDLQLQKFIRNVSQTDWNNAVKRIKWRISEIRPTGNTNQKIYLGILCLPLKIRHSFIFPQNKKRLHPMVVRRSYVILKWYEL